MFVAGEVLLDRSFPAAEARLANLARGGSLARVTDVLARSQEAPGAVQGTGTTGAAARRAAAERS